jgi:hypothetical protein
MDREIYSIKGNPRPPLKVPCGETLVRRLTLARRLRFSPMNIMSCGNQPANIRATDRRVKFPCSFYYFILFFLTSITDVSEVLELVPKPGWFWNKLLETPVKSPGFPFKSKVAVSKLKF